MKRSIGVIMACALVLAMGLVALAAVTTADQATKVTGGGWYISDYAPSTGNHCSLGFQAGGPALGFGGKDAWSGQGSYTDRDFRLKAHLIIDTAETHPTVAGWMQLSGKARVTVNKAKEPDLCPFKLAIQEATPDRVYFEVTWSGGTYKSHGPLSGGETKYH